MHSPIVINAGDAESVLSRLKTARLSLLNRKESAEDRCTVAAFAIGWAIGILAKHVPDEDGAA